MNGGVITPPILISTSLIRERVLDIVAIEATVLSQCAGPVANYICLDSRPCAPGTRKTSHLSTHLVLQETPASQDWI
jgi:hypothetical protein